jgi:O-antigen ligase
LLAVPIIYSCLIAIFQFLKGGSLDGVFWWLGERTFTLSTPGIARADLGGRLFLRPYATFPHPNVLAGFLLVGLILVSCWSKRKGVVYWLVWSLGIAAVFLSFSRMVWLVGLAIGGIRIFLLRRSKLNLAVGALLIAVIILIFLKTPFLFRVGYLSISRRLELARAAIEMVRAHPAWGVGLGNFIVQLPFFWRAKEGIRFFQPVHNIFLLVAAEAGLVGLLTFLWFLFLTFQSLLKTRSLKGLVLLSVILLTGMVDHYWLTLQQGQLLFTFVLGLIWKKERIVFLNPGQVAGRRLAIDIFRRPDFSLGEAEGSKVERGSKDC